MTAFTSQRPERLGIPVIRRVGRPFVKSQDLTSSARGFTLIELLTVVAVIAILAMLLVPVVSQVRMTARRSLCAANLRQIGIGLHLYTNDHNGLLPETSEAGTDPATGESLSWVFTLAPYLDDVDEVRVCPDDPRAEQRKEQSLSSYVVNEYLFKQESDPFGQTIASYRNIENLRHPSATMAVFTGADRLPLSTSNDHAHTRSWEGSWSAVLSDIQPDRFRVGSPAPDRSDGNANYLYADGHVTAIGAAEMKGWIDAGENPARPPEAEGE